MFHFFKISISISNFSKHFSKIISSFLGPIFPQNDMWHGSQIKKNERFRSYLYILVNFRWLKLLIRHIASFLTFQNPENHNGGWGRGAASIPFTVITLFISLFSIHFFLHSPMKVGGGTPYSFNFLYVNYRKNFAAQKRGGGATVLPRMLRACYYFRCQPS